MKVPLAIAIVSGLTFAALMPAQDSQGVERAIQFEKAKAAAAARQARAETGEHAAPDATAEQAGEAKADSGVQSAVAFERAKAAAAARQARREARQPGERTDVQPPPER